LNGHHDLVHVLEEFVLVSFDQLATVLVSRDTLIGSCCGLNLRRQFEQREDEWGKGVLHSVGASFHKNLLDFEQLCVVLIVVGVVNLVDHFSHGILALIELIWVLFRSLFVVCQKGLDELNQLIDSLRGIQNNFVLDDHLNDLNGDSSLVLELHILHQRWVVVH